MVTRLLTSVAVLSCPSVVADLQPVVVARVVTELVVARQARSGTARPVVSGVTDDTVAVRQCHRLRRLTVIIVINHTVFAYKNFY